MKNCYTINLIVKINTETIYSTNMKLTFLQKYTYNYKKIFRQSNFYYNLPKWLEFYTYISHAYFWHNRHAFAFVPVHLLVELYSLLLYK